MNPQDLHGKTLDGDTFSRINQALGANERNTGNAVQFALSVLPGALTHNSSMPTGTMSLMAACDRDHASSVMGDVVGSHIRRPHPREENPIRRSAHKDQKKRSGPKKRGSASGSRLHKFLRDLSSGQKPRFLASLCTFLILTFALATEASADNTLRVHPSNPRYFTDNSGRAIYLTGSHDHTNLQDFTVERAEVSRNGSFGRTAIDYNSYLDFLQQRNHNFMRMWMWEHSIGTPRPYNRPGPGTALDGEPKYNVNQFNQAYFERLWSRVKAAQDRGIYVSIMLFQGWSIQTFIPSLHVPWPGHPYNPANNVNGINGDPNGNNQGEEVHTFQVPAITALQEAYVRRVIDWVNEFDNVIFEISNESTVPSTSWQYHMINVIRNYESNKPKQHPIWMSCLMGYDNNALFASSAEAVAPCGLNFDSPNEPYIVNPPVADGSKVSLLDSDHLAFQLFVEQTPAFQRAWVWKSFLRGHNPTLMDYGLLGGTVPPFDPARWAMGHTLTYADKMNLAAMTPQNNLSSTGYCLANPGSEYLIYKPTGGGQTFTVNLAAGSYAFEWFNPNAGTIAGTGTITASGGNQSFTAPFGGDSVLYLRSGGGGGGSLAAQISSLWPVNGAVPGSNATLWAQVRNSGSSTLPGNARVWFYVDGPSAPGWVGSTSVAGLTPGSTQWFSFTWAIPSNQPNGNYNYFGQVWTAVAISPPSGTQPFTIGSGGGGSTVSAVIPSLWPVSGARRGVTVTLWAQVQNTGSSALPGNARVWFYVGGGSYPGWVGSASVAGLAPGSTQWFSFNWAIPASTATGNYNYVGQVWTTTQAISPWSEYQFFTISP
jgi:Family of unknown function (DUF6298)/CARDB/Bacterial protein of unknown function (DUF937)/Putative collagen-binding domain of a collagenase